MGFIRKSPILILYLVALGGFALLVISLIRTAAYSERPFAIESYDLNAIVTYLEIIAIAAAAFIAISHFQHTRAAAYIERFNDVESFPFRRAVDEWLAEYVELFSPNEDDARDLLAMIAEDRLSELDKKTQFHLVIYQARLLQELEENYELKREVIAFANFFQELGQAYLLNMCSRQYARRMFDYLAPEYWRRLSFWVYHYRRLAGNDTLYSRFEMLVNDLSKTPAEERIAQWEMQKELTKPEPQPYDAWLNHIQQTHDGRTYIFGYGSIFNKDSLRHTLSDDAADDDSSVLAVLDGFERCWNVVDEVEFLGGDEKVNGGVIFLNLVPHPGTEVNGVLVPLPREAAALKATLAEFDAREKNYVRVDVTRWVKRIARCKGDLEYDRLGPADRVYTYIGLPDYILPPAGGYIASQDKPTFFAARYEAIVEAGVDKMEQLYPGFRAMYAASTAMPPADIPVRQEEYRFCSAEQNRATGRG